jgi:hypothetical protein
LRTLMAADIPRAQAIDIIIGAYLERRRLRGRAA